MISRLDMLVDGKSFTQFIWFKGGAFIGSIQLCFIERIGDNLRACRSASIRNLFVHRSFRHQGIGSALVKECLNVAAGHGCETLGLVLAKNNIETAEFYKTLGFVFAYEFADGDFCMVRVLEGRT